MNQTTELEIVEPSALESLTRAEIDSQVSTAKKYPRRIGVVKSDMLSFATLDTDTAAACFYSLPRGGKTIQGPSIRLAEIAIACYGNLRAGSRVMSVSANGDNPHVVIQSVCHDLEKNTAITIEKRRRITSKKNRDGTRKPVDEDDINLAVNACSAIALRDAVFKVIPLALINPVLEQAKRVAIGDAKTLNDRRSKALEHFAKMGIQKDKILVHLGKATVDEIDLKDLETLIGLHTAIKEGTTSIDEAFNAPEQAAKEGAAVKGQKATVVVQAKPVEAPIVVEIPTTQETTDSSLYRLSNVMAVAGFNFDALAETCMLDETLKKSSELWTCMDDITEAQAAYILSNLSVTNGEMKWKRGTK